jgi:hypothetical protein
MLTFDLCRTSQEAELLLCVDVAAPLMFGVGRAFNSADGGCRDLETVTYFIYTNQTTLGSNLSQIMLK